MQSAYVHGYGRTESVRLRDQASTLEELLHADTRYPAGAEVLEAGCGVGAQTVPLAHNSPAARITAIDIAPRSLAQAEARVAAAGLANVRFLQADLGALPFPDGCFDHAFVCFVLEHVPCVATVLAELRRVVKAGGSLTAIEGDHGSAFFHPDSAAARAAIRCQVELQRAADGDALIGRRLYPLLAGAGFAAIQVSPRMVYADASRPDLGDGFVRKTFTAMVAGVRTAALAGQLADAESFDAGIRALECTAEVDGVFCYTFFKAVCRRA